MEREKDQIDDESNKVDEEVVLSSLPLPSTSVKRDPSSVDLLLDPSLPSNEDNVTHSVLLILTKVMDLFRKNKYLSS